MSCLQGRPSTSENTIEEEYHVVKRRGSDRSIAARLLPDKARNAKALFQLDLTGDAGGPWVVDVADGQCQVRQGLASQPDATLTMDAHDFVALFNNKLDPVQAFMAGKIKVAGNLGLVMQLLNWFQRGQ